MEVNALHLLVLEVELKAERIGSFSLQRMLLRPTHWGSNVATSDM